MVGPRLACALVASALLVPGCVLAPVDLEDRPCPCAAGWSCDTARDRCVRELADAGSAPDAHVEDPTTACDDLLRDALFCESFEDPSLLHWTVQEAYDGTVGYTRERAFRGVGALAASTSATGGYAERIASVLGSITEGDVHVRAYVYVPEGAPLVHSSILHIGGHRSRVATEPLAGFNAMDGFASMYVGAGDFHVDDQLVAVPRDRWFCVQLQVHVDDVAGEARIWIDQTLAGERVGVDTRPEGPYESLGAGIAWSTLTQEPFTVLVDEIAIARTPMPCE